MMSRPARTRRQGIMAPRPISPRSKRRLLNRPGPPPFNAHRSSTRPQDIFSCINHTKACSSTLRASALLPLYDQVDLCLSEPYAAHSAKPVRSRRWAGTFLRHVLVFADDSPFQTFTIVVIGTSLRLLRSYGEWLRQRWTTLRP